MSGVALCRNDSCERKETCFRFKNETQGSEYLEFQNICKGTNYLWYWHKDIAPAVVEGNKEN